MPLGHYDTGTISITTATSLVQGVGTAWIGVNEFDAVYTATGLLVGFVDTVDPDTQQIVLKKAWGGSTLSGVAYQIELRPFDLSFSAKNIRELRTILDAFTILYHVSGAAPDPALGEDGQHAIKINGSTIQFWVKVGGVWDEIDTLAGGDLDGPASAIINHIPQFAAADGKSIKDSGYKLVQANLTLFVKTAAAGGNDTTGDGLATGTAWATLQKASDVIKTLFIPAGITVTVDVADGTYTGNGTADLVTINGWSGGGRVIFDGNTTTPANVILSGNTKSVFLVAGGSNVGSQLRVQGFRMSTTSAGFNLRHSGQGEVSFETNEYGTAGVAFLTDIYGASILVKGTNSVFGSPTFGKFFDADSGGYIQTTGTLSGSGVTITGSFAASRLHGNLISQMSFAGLTGTTGVRFEVREHGVIDTQNAGLTYFPGNAAGLIHSGGSYDGKGQGFSGTFTRDMTAASGSQGVTTGFQPSKIMIQAGLDGQFRGSTGFYDGTTQSVNVVNAVFKGVAAGTIITVTDGAGNIQSGVIAFTATGFNIVWTKTGTPAAGTAYMNYLCW